MARFNHWLPAVAALILAVALANSPAALAKHKHGNLPDLVVKTVPLAGQPYAVNGKRPNRATEFQFVVANQSAVPAGNGTKARVKLVHGSRGSFNIGYKHIRNLPPHQGDQVKAATPVLREDAGAYRVKACADAGNKVKESDEGNNCDFFKLSEPHFYVVNNRYTGTVAGLQDRTAEGGWLESWRMPSATFGPPEHIGQGTFNYAISGTVFYTDSNSPPPLCDVTGSGAGSVTGELQLQFEGDVYDGQGSTATSYPIFKCGTVGDTGPFAPEVLQTFGDDFMFPTLAFGNHIGGSATSDNETWTWSLDGAD